MAAEIPAEHNCSPGLVDFSYHANLCHTAHKAKKSSYDPHGGKYSEVYDSLNASALSTKELTECPFDSAVSHPTAS
jgi:hypothetical protein